VTKTEDSITPAVSSKEILENLKAADTVQKDSVNKPQFLTGVLDYSAKDYMRLNPKENKVYLYDEAKIVYGDMTIEAGLIVIDNNSNEFYAYGIEDSLGEYVQKPVFTQANRKVEPDSLRFYCRILKS